MEILNFVNGEWIKPNVSEYFDVINPATGQVIAKTPLGTKADVDAAAQAASEAFPAWRRTPVNERVQYLFKLRDISAPTATRLPNSSRMSAVKPLTRPKPKWCALTKMWKWPAGCRTSAKANLWKTSPLALMS